MIIITMIHITLSEIIHFLRLSLEIIIEVIYYMNVITSINVFTFCAVHWDPLEEVTLTTSPE